jgi:hypothetical protein
MVSVEGEPLMEYHTGSTMSISPVTLSTVPGVKVTDSFASYSPTTLGEESITTDEVAIAPTAKF